MRRTSGKVPNELLVSERQQRGWSREYLAARLGVADPKTIGRWERGEARPSPYFLQQLCALFERPASALGLYTAAASPLVQEPVGLPNQSSRELRPLFDPAQPQFGLESGQLSGRIELLHQVQQRLISGGGATTVAFYGLPGVGKTALAVALASDPVIKEHFGDGLLWVSLGPKPELKLHLERWGQLLGIPPAPLARPRTYEEWQQAIRGAIGARRLLIVIDDVWNTAEALAFRTGGPNCAYLLTSRQPAIAVRSANAGAFVVSELNEQSSLQLLAHFIPSVVQAEPEALRELVAAVGGLPLALVLLGRYLQAQIYSGQPRRLETALQRLRSAETRLQILDLQMSLESHADLPIASPLSLQTLLAPSFWRLEPALQQMLARLAVLSLRPGSISETLALTISGATLEQLDALTDEGLLTTAGPGHYQLHPVLADYARSQLLDVEVCLTHAPGAHLVPEPAQASSSLRARRLSLRSSKTRRPGIVYPVKESMYLFSEQSNVPFGSVAKARADPLIHSS